MIFVILTLIFIPGWIYAQPTPVKTIGIGIANPTRATLVVHGAVGATTGIFGGESSGVSLQRNLPAIGFNQYFNGSNKYIANGFAAVQFFDHTNGNMVIDLFPSGAKDASAPSLNRALVIGSNGNVGIKTNSINASLYVAKAGSGDGSAVFGGTHYNSHFHYAATEDNYIRAGKAGGNIYISDVPNGKVIIGSGSSYVGINTSSPVYPLEIRQTGATGIILVEPNNAFNNWEQVVGLYNEGPQSSLKLIYNGILKCFFRPTDGAFVTVSDERLKTGILPLSPVLNKMLQLRPVEYEINHNSASRENAIGFIAQEVQPIFPGLVATTGNAEITGKTFTDFHTINYDAFKTLSIKLVQEEQFLIVDLQKRQQEISRKLEAIEKKLSIKVK